MKIFNEKNELIDHKNIEHIEQELTSKYIKPHHKVLELGARYGSVSIITNKIVQDKKSHYVVEPDKEVWDCLASNMKINNCDFNIIKGIIGKNKYKLEGEGYAKTSVLDNNSDVKLYELPEIDFNALIVDCEGFLEIFYNENKSLFNKLELMIIECDEPKKCNYQYLLNEFNNLKYEIVEKINHYGLEYYVFKKKPINLLFCSLSDRPELSEVHFNHLQDYCNKHNYKCVLENKSLDQSRHQSWSKIILLKREMEKNKDIDYAIWIDDDILITDKDKKFEDFIDPNENVSVSQDALKDYPMNLGIMICKNNNETLNYLQYIWDICETKYPQHKLQPNWEQCVITKDYIETNLNNPNQNHIIKILPYKTIQSFYRHGNLDWEKGDFSAHFTGMNLQDRIILRNKILKILY